MANPWIDILPGLILSIISCVPSIIFALVNKNRLPEICASFFAASHKPWNFLKRSTFVSLTILLSVLTALFCVVLGLILYFLPIETYSGLGLASYKTGNRGRVLSTLMYNMWISIGCLTAIFLISVLIPTWNGNIYCVIDPDNRVPCDYKIIVWPQVIIYVLAVVAIFGLFIYLIKKKAPTETLISTEQEPHV